MTTRINQKELSDYVLTGLLQRFPQFMDYYKLDNDILTIEYPSSQRLLSLWITTQNLEVTVGFDGKNGQCNWHVHMSQFGANNPDEELKEAVNLVNNILIGNEIIAFNSTFGYYLTDNPSDEIKNKQKNEILEFKRWNEL
jgi:hypothetical protein